MTLQKAPTVTEVSAAPNTGAVLTPPVPGEAVLVNSTSSADLVAPSSIDVFTNPIIDIDIRGTQAPSAVAQQQTEQAQSRQVALRNADEPWQVIYGECMVRGTITFGTLDQGSEGKWMHAIWTYAGHEVDRVNYVYFNGVLFTHGENSGNLMYPTTSAWGEGYPWGFDVKNVDSDAYAFASFDNLGHPDQAANVHAVSQSSLLFPGKWTVRHKQSGRAHAYFIWYYDAARFAAAFPPDIQAFVRGKKCYDPREESHDIDDPETWEWTDNVALCAADFLMNVDFGMKTSASKIRWGTSASDHGSVWWAADKCDEEVDLANGGTEKRFTCNGTFKVGEIDNGTLLQNFARAMAGAITTIGGIFHFFPGVYVAPEIELTNDDILSVVQTDVMPSRQSTFNAVAGRFIGVETNHEFENFGTVTNEQYKENANGYLWANMDMPFTNSSFMARRIARIALEEEQQGLTTTLLCGLKALQLQTRDTVLVTRPSMGWAQKPFLVRKVEVETSPTYWGVKVFLQETAEAVYTQDPDAEVGYDLAPNTNLPAPGENIQNPTALVLNSTDYLRERGDGTILAGLNVSWTAPADPISWGTGTEVWYKESTSNTWLFWQLVANPATQTTITDLVEGRRYDVRVRSVTTLNIKAPTWVLSLFHLVVGKTAKPNPPSNLRAQITNRVTLSWDRPTDIDVREFWVFRDGVLIGKPDTTEFHDPTLAAGNYVYQVYSYDTSKNLSDTAASITISIAGPATPTATYELSGENVIFRWTVPEVVGVRFPIDDYIIRYGASFAAGTEVAIVKGTGYSTRVDWSGVRFFWVASRDIHGNIGTAAKIPIEIVPPGHVRNLNPDVYDNTVILRFDANAGTLPIKSFRLYRGNTLASARVAGAIQDANSTLLFHFESVGGYYTYWVTTVDSAGTESEAVGVRTFVNQPPDFILRADQVLQPVFADTYNLYVGVDEQVVGGFDARLIPNLRLWLDATKEVDVDNENRVLSWQDQSGYNRHATQATQSKQPVLSRKDNKENLLLSTNLISNPDLTLINCAIVSAPISHPGLFSAYLMKESLGSSDSHGFNIKWPQIAGTSYVFTFDCATYGERNIWVRDRSGESNRDASIRVRSDITGGVGTISDEALKPDISLVDLGSGWWRISILLHSNTTNYSTTKGLQIRSLSADGTSILYAGNGSSGLVFARMSIRSVSASSDHIDTNGARAYRGRNNQSVVVFDGVDDILTSSATLADVIEEDAFTVFAVAAPNGIGQDGTATTPYNDDVVIADAGTFFAISMRRRHQDNYLTTQDLTDAYWVKTSSTVSSGESDPEGGSLAYKIEETDDVSATYINTGTFSVEKGVTYRFQFKVKADERSFIATYVGGGANNAEAVYNLSTGATTTTGGTIFTAASIESIGSGWHLATIDLTPTSNFSNCRAYLYVRGPANEFSYDGTTGYGAIFFEPFFSVHSASTLTPVQFYNYGSAAAQLEEPLTGAGQYDVMMFKRDSSNIYSSINGSTEQSLASDAVSTLSNAIVLGGRTSSTGHAPIKLAEVLVFDRTLSTIEIARLTRYLTIKWANEPSYVSADINTVDMIGPVNTEKTWQEHFGYGVTSRTRRSLLGLVSDPTDNTIDSADAASILGLVSTPFESTDGQWANFQEQLDAGFPFLAHPTPQGAYYEHIVDFGVDLPASIITLSYKEELLYGAGVEVVPTLSVATSADPMNFQRFDGQSRIFATSARYVKVELAFNALDARSIAKVSSVRLRIDAKLTRDSGRYTYEVETHGTQGAWVSFNKPFIDVNSDPSADVIGKLAKAVVSFDGSEANPTGFYVVVYDIDPSSTTYGQLIDGSGSWSVDGYIGAGE